MQICAIDTVFTLLFNTGNAILAQLLLGYAGEVAVAAPYAKDREEHNSQKGKAQPKRFAAFGVGVPGVPGIPGVLGILRVLGRVF